MKLEYLLFNFLVITGPILALVFYPKAVFVRVKPAFLAIGITAFFFILWDILVTGWFWTFNPSFILGYQFFTIPLEEALFFLTVPSACLFLYVNFLKIWPKPKNYSLFFLQKLAYVFLLLSLVFLLLDKYYTFSVFFLIAVLWFLDKFVFKIQLTARLVYWLFLLIVLALTAFFNYYLTSRPVVLYNNQVNLNWRIVTIPVEDFVYSVCLITSVLLFYEFFKLKKMSLK